LSQSVLGMNKLKLAAQAAPQNIMTSTNATNLGVTQSTHTSRMLELSLQRMLGSTINKNNRATDNGTFTRIITSTAMRIRTTTELKTIETRGQAIIPGE